MATKTDSNGNIVTFELDTKNTYVGETMAFNINVTTGGLDTSNATATAEDIKIGKTAYVDGSLVTGIHEEETFTTQEKTISPNENIQTIIPEDGYNGLSKVTVNAIDSNYIGSAVTRVAARDYTPGTSDQIIAASQYLTGAQTIKGDANLVAENIAKDVTIFGITGTHQGGSSGGTDTSDATATSADILSGKTAYVNGVKITGGYSIVTATANATTSSDSTSIDFTVSGNPLAWSVVQTANTRDWGNTRFICACNSDGNSTSMTTESQYGRQYAYANYISATYTSDLDNNENTLTVSTSNSSNTGTFRGGTAYQLLYVYASVTEPEPEPDLPDGEVGYISTNNVISLSDTKLPAGTYTLYYEDENENKLEGWSAIGSISKGGH